MKFVLLALIFASSALVCVFAWFSNSCLTTLVSLSELPHLKFAKPIAHPEAVFEGSARRVVGDLMKKLNAIKQVDTLALIHAAAEKHQVPAALVKSIVAAESNFHCEAVSPKGAIGLMQLMPATAQQYGADPNIPEQNVDAGTRYLYFLMQKYRKHRNPLPRVIAAYNAGPGAVDRYRGIPPFRETRGYVARVMGFMRQYSKKPA
jgi:hypothetical protein